ncbi:MAG: hypothetical protein EXS10_01270 [Phycisphaerales bacterium]|nr:hypothetical protein [Phycisphaerales bacterium]
MTMRTAAQFRLAIAFECTRGVSLALFASVALSLASCKASPESIDDPAALLTETGRSVDEYDAALTAVEMRGLDKASTAALRRLVVAEGIAYDVRSRAFDILAKADRVALAEAITKGLPRMGDLVWRETLCEKIAATKLEGTEIALVRGWANLIPAWSDDAKRPERLALAAIVGESNVVPFLLKTLRNANPVSEANLRIRCFELLVRCGQKEILVAALLDPAQTKDDALLTDLATITRDLGIVPSNREEILWARKLCEPSRAEFLAAAKAALAKMPIGRRSALELRSVSIAIACAALRPELLARNEPEMYAELEQRVKARKKVSPDFSGFGSDFTENLYEVRNSLVWGDLAAMLIALDVLDQEPLQRAIFQLADRDREERSTEFGGVLSMRADSRGVLTEFPPRVRSGDTRFESSQALFDALYEGLFHFHNHAQAYDNDKYAGPHLGDFQFALASRANCLVFAFLSEDELGVDFYRHGPLVVDLGAMTRPEN